jgi:hypothetical protein
MGRSSKPAATPAPAPAPVAAPAPQMTPASVFRPATPAPAAPAAPAATAMPAGMGNVYQQSQQALSAAQQTANRLANFQYTPMQAAQLAAAERMQSVGQVGDVSAPGQIDVNQLATTNLAPYMNPYTQQVIEAGQSDIERQRQLASRQMAARAGAAGAFGGSRQAVQEGILAGEALREAGALSAQQRQRAFETALQAGQFDIGQMQAARTLASQQQMQANTLNQQASEMAAAREQAARAGNMAAANQFAIQQAQLQQAANQANLQAQFQQAAVQQGAASQLGGLAQTGFGFGQAITQQQAQQGAMQQAAQQAVIDAARGQYAGLTGAPAASLGLPLQALGAAPIPQTTTQSRQPGLFDYLTLGTMAAAGRPF